MNVHIISGRLTRDPEVRFSQTGKTVTSFTVAVRRDYKNQAIYMSSTANINHLSFIKIVTD